VFVIGVFVIAMPVISVFVIAMPVISVFVTIVPVIVQLILLQRSEFAKRVFRDPAGFAQCFFTGSLRLQFG
jgi:hypothetical protein